MEKFAENAEETSSNHAIDILWKGNIMPLQILLKYANGHASGPYTNKSIATKQYKYFVVNFYRHFLGNPKEGQKKSYTKLVLKLKEI